MCIETSEQTHYTRIYISLCLCAVQHIHDLMYFLSDDMQIHWMDIHMKEIDQDRNQLVLFSYSISQYIPIPNLFISTCLSLSFLCRSYICVCMVQVDKQEMFRVLEHFMGTDGKPFFWVTRVIRVPPYIGHPFLPMNSGTCSYTTLFLFRFVSPSVKWCPYRPIISGI